MGCIIGTPDIDPPYSTIATLSLRKLFLDSIQILEIRFNLFKYENSHFESLFKGKLQVQSLPRLLIYSNILID